MAETYQVVLEEDWKLRIPEELGTSLHVSPGSIFEIDNADETGIHLRIVGPEDRIVNKGGVLVLQGGNPEGMMDIVERLREERDLQNMGYLSE